MAQRVIVDYAYLARVRPRRHRSRLPTVVAAAVIVAVLAAAGLTGGRALWRQIRYRPSATSHPMTTAQLAALPQIHNPRDASDARDRPDSAKVASVPAHTALPAAATLSVAYTVQAPFGNWKVFENACEEAALLMYHDYLEGGLRTEVPPTEADKQMRAMEAWQVTNWGADRDLTMEKTGQLAHAYYGYHYQVIAATEDNIKAQIAAGRPVIVPAMTHSLQNPNYGPQTVYHEVFIKGYTDAGVVTNDAGVKEGKNWFYAWSVLFGAIDAQTPKMGQGRLALILSR